MASLCGNGWCRWFGVPVSNEGLLLPLVFAQRWHFHLGLARIGPRHGFAVVAQDSLAHTVQDSPPFLPVPPTRSGSCAARRL